MTETGEIFSLGRELQDVLKGRPRGRPLRLFVGISEMVPKLIAYRVLQPVLAMSEPVQIICEEDSPERLLADLTSSGTRIDNEGRRWARGRSAGGLSSAGERPGGGAGGDRLRTRSETWN